MKALDKVFDTQVITGIIGDRISFHWSKKKISYMKRRKTRKTVSRVTIVTEENPTEFIKDP